VKAFGGRARQPATPRARAYGLLSLALLVLGFAPLLVRYAREAPGPVIAAYRMTGAWLLASVWITVLLRRGQRPRRGRAWLWAGLGGVCFGLDLALWSTGVARSNATTPTLMVNTAPLWVGLATRFVWREPLPRRFWPAIGLMLFGAALVLTQGRWHALAWDEGAWWGLTAAWFFAAYQMFAQRARAQLSTPWVFWITTGAAAAALWPLIVLAGWPWRGFRPHTWAALAGLAVVVQSGGWLLIQEVQGRLPAAVIAPVLLGQPVLTAFLAAGLLGERLTAAQIAGGALVLASVYMVVRGAEPTREVLPTRSPRAP